MTQQKLVSWLIPAFFVFAAAVLVWFIVSHAEQVTNENRTYNRFIACGLSVPAEARTQDKIDQCWDMVQEDTGTNVKRYDVR